MMKPISRTGQRYTRAAGTLMVLAALLCTAPEAWTQSFPAKPITLVVPYPPGGASDVFARLLAENLRQPLGQPVVVENKPGAGSLVGTRHVSRATADGYTLLLTGSALTIQAAINKQFGLNLERDFTPVSEAVRGSFLIATPASQPFRNLGEMVAYAREHPEALRFGTNGAGTSSAMIFEYLMSITGAPLLHVPYKGSSEVVNALLAGDVQLIADPVYTLHKHVEAGTLRALAVTGSTRSELLPDVPTVQESGVEDFDIGYWMGVLAPAGTPTAVVERLSRAMSDAIKDPDMGKRIATLGFEPSGSTPEAFAKTLQQEQAIWTDLARTRNLWLE
ncbi:Bug family tripartite tricarboxylate transporter substrate binding protein [Verticiella sediminum]|nr:tripartite tricarboxylate transporter substrate binding protein [Verticiella sediminum]